MTLGRGSVRKGGLRGMGTGAVMRDVRVPGHARVRGGVLADEGRTGESPRTSISAGGGTGPQGTASPMPQGTDTAGHRTQRTALH